MQGVVKAYDPSTGIGVVIADSDLIEYDLAPHALQGSLFRMLRQGQRVVFQLDDRRQVTRLRLGAEADMGTPGFPMAHNDDPTRPRDDAPNVPPAQSAI